ncbi:MAG: phosphoglycerate kinase [Rhodospirillaceae bacterium]|nr:phosphoglycerate kinase [Rhodospirillaceae bacterium]
MPQFKTIDQADVAGKRVLVRADLNVPMKNGAVTDATRLERLVPTLKDLAAKNAKVIVLSHFDRPKGKRVPEMSLKPVAAALSKLVGQNVAFAEDCVGTPAEKVIAGLKGGEIAVLENLRYHNGEEANDAAFVKQLAALGDIYVNDAFSAAHRAHASTEGLAHVLPAYAGRQMQAELEALGAALENPQKPVMAIVGGSKVSTKLDVLSNLVKRVNILVIGGGMANTFLHAQGIGVGKSLCEKDLAEQARTVLAQAMAHNCRIVLPQDALIADCLKPGVDTTMATIGNIPDDQMILDIGPASSAALAAQLAECKTLLWNGPVGAFETKPFDAGTMAIAQAAADLTKRGKLVSIAGGGDTVAALNAAGVADAFTYVSTAGGAFLEWLEGKDLPGVKALAG